MEKVPFTNKNLSWFVLKAFLDVVKNNKKIMTQSLSPDFINVCSVEASRIEEHGLAIPESWLQSNWTSRVPTGQIYQKCTHDDPKSAVGDALGKLGSNLSFETN